MRLFDSKIIKWEKGVTQKLEQRKKNQESSDLDKFKIEET